MSETHAFCSRQPENTLLYVGDVYLLLQDRRGHDRQLILLSDWCLKEGLQTKHSIVTSFSFGRYLPTFNGFDY